MSETTKVLDEQFVTTWEDDKHTSIEDVAKAMTEQTGKRWSKNKCQLLASEYRKAGIPLRLFRKPKAGPKEIDTDAGVKLLAKLRGTTAAKIKEEAAEQEKERKERLAKRKKTTAGS